MLSIFLLVSFTACGEGGGHTHSLIKVEEKAADCENAGHHTYYECETCRKVFSDASCKTEVTKDAMEIPALGHAWVEATCTEQKHCENCGITDGRPATHHWVEATCMTPKYCTECFLIEGEPLDHVDANIDRKCDRCGADVKGTDIDLPGQPF